MKAALLVLAVLFLMVLVMGGLFIGSRNELVTEQEAVRAQFAQVDVVMQRRNDLVPNLVSTVKGFAQQEQKVFGDIANARAAMVGAKTNQEKIDANSQLSGALSRLLVVVENYPQLKSSEHFQDLMRQLEGAENRISQERRKYDQVVQKYNTDLKIFPKSMVAGMSGFQPEPYFKADEGARVAPKVTF